MFAQAGLSGTLFLSKGERSTLLLIRQGKTQATDLGAPYNLSAVGAQYSFWPQSLNQAGLNQSGPNRVGDERPTVGARYPESQGPLRALPALLEESLPDTSETDLRALFARLVRTRFSGALVLKHPTLQGLFLFQTGVLGAAIAEAPERIRQGSAALRSALQALQGDESGALTLHPLPGLLSSSLLGLALADPRAQQAEQSEPAAGIRTGVLVGEAGYTFLKGGAAYLDLITTPTTPHGFFSACERPASLTLPSEPPGWEERRYALTLRGRDALNPMTELAMHFKGEFGPTGQRALEQFRKVLDTEAAAEALGLELGELRSYVERLEAEGFIRQLGAR
jgi:hypothetical protein